jgi:hypothetical protein
MTNFQIAALALIACGVVAGQAPTLTITSPANGAVVPSGQTLTVTVAASGGNFQGVWLGGNLDVIFQPVAGSSYQFTAVIPATTHSGTYWLTAGGAVQPSAQVNEASISIDVERPDAPVALANDSRTLGLEYVGDSEYLLVDGTFADGSKVELQRSSLTTYASDNPAVATVDSTGLVTATGPGITNIKITNNGASTTVPVSVPQWVNVMPASISLNPSGTEQFVARVQMLPGTDLSVAWSIQPALGSIDGRGVYTAPFSVDSATRVVVTATSVADPTKSRSAEVLLLPPIAVSVSPNAVTLGGGQTKRFVATVRNTESKDVTWSIEPSGIGSIDDKGNYTAPASIASPQTVTITATSDADEAKRASASVKLVPGQGGRR